MNDLFDDSGKIFVLFLFYCWIVPDRASSGRILISTVAAAAAAVIVVVVVVFVWFL